MMAIDTVNNTGSLRNVHGDAQQNRQGNLHFSIYRYIRTRLKDKHD